ncbi:hypothetical protein AAC387_Pa10g1216 [Persea americana]
MSSSLYAALPAADSTLNGPCQLGANFPSLGFRSPGSVFFRTRLRSQPGHCFVGMPGWSRRSGCRTPGRSS